MVEDTRQIRKGQTPVRKNKAFVIAFNFIFILIFFTKAAKISDCED